MREMATSGAHAAESAVNEAASFAFGLVGGRRVTSIPVLSCAQARLARLRLHIADDSPQP